MADLESWLGLFLQPLTLFGQAESRFFWLFCVSSLGFAVWVLWLQTKPSSLKAFAATLQVRILSRDIWFKKSTLVDLASLFGNSALRALVVIPLLGGHLAFALVVARALQSHFGNFPQMEWSWFAIATLFTLVFFLLEDLSRFSLHWAMHRLPFLWRFHRFHHSSQNLTPLTLFRIHPVEMMLYYARGLLVFGLVSGSFIYIFGKNLSGWQILGVDALGFIFNFFAANLRHSPIWMSFGKLESWFISPAQHQIHHSRHAQHRDKNLGTCLTLWDKLLGSHIPAGKQPLDLQFGLSSER